MKTLTLGLDAGQSQGSQARVTPLRQQHLTACMEHFNPLPPRKPLLGFLPFPLERVNVLIGKDKAEADFRVSNVFRREGSEWRMVHHHVDLNQTMLECAQGIATGAVHHSDASRLR